MRPLEFLALMIGSALSASAAAGALAVSWYSNTQAGEFLAEVHGHNLEAARAVATEGELRASMLDLQGALKSRLQSPMFVYGKDGTYILLGMSTKERPYVWFVDAKGAATVAVDGTQAARRSTSGGSQSSRSTSGGGYYCDHVYVGKEFRTTGVFSAKWRVVGFSASTGQVTAREVSGWGITDEFSCSEVPY